jgi:hypothetical protein
MLSIGLKLQHHCLNGLLPLLVAALTMPQAQNPIRVPLSYGAAIAASSLFGGTLPRALRTIRLRSRFLLRRNELIAQLFRLTPDLIF